MVLHYLRRLGKLNASTNEFSRQTSPFIVMFYYIVLVILEGCLFIILDYRSAPILNTLALNFAGIITSVALIFFLSLASVNFFSRRLVAPLKRFQCGVALSARTKLKLDHCLDDIAGNRIGITCGNIFMFSAGKLIMVTITFALNFFLTINLFESYFFRASGLH